MGTAMLAAAAWFVACAFSSLMTLLFHKCINFPGISVLLHCLGLLKVLDLSSCIGYYGGFHSGLKY